MVSQNQNVLIRCALKCFSGLLLCLLLTDTAESILSKYKLLLIHCIRITASFSSQKMGAPGWKLESENPPVTHEALSPSQNPNVELISTPHAPNRSKTFNVTYSNFSPQALSSLLLANTITKAILSKYVPSCPYSVPYPSKVGHLQVKHKVLPMAQSHGPPRPNHFNSSNQLLVFSIPVIPNTSTVFLRHMHHSVYLQCSFLK